jgi:nicotinamide-nucleotide amidase
MVVITDPATEPARAHTHVLVIWGVEREDLARRVEQLGVDDGGLQIELFPPGRDGVHLRLSDDDPDRLSWAVGVVRSGLGDIVVGEEGASLEAVVVDLLRRQGLHLATAESLTSGGLSSRLSEPPGSTEVFAGGVVAYSVEAKRRLLDVHGPVITAEAAMEMAEGAARALGTEVAVALTGVAGPAPMEGEPVGTVYVGSWMEGEAASVALDLSGDRQEVREAAASHALDHLRHRLMARERRVVVRR